MAVIENPDTEHPDQQSQDSCQTSARQLAGLSGSFISGLSLFLISGVKLYQITLSRFLGGHCRFEPSCSYYFIEAVRKYGPFKGAWKGLARICRCHPFHPGGFDPP